MPTKRENQIKKQIHNKKIHMNQPKKIKEIRITKNTKFTTFDIKKLTYTNIPIDEILHIIQSKLTNKEENKQIITCIKTIVNQNYFRFTDKTYKQNANGKPNIGYTIGNLLTRIGRKTLLQFEIKLQYKYNFPVCR